MSQGATYFLDGNPAILRHLSERRSEGLEGEHHATPTCKLALEFPEHRIGPWADLVADPAIGHQPLTLCAVQEGRPFREEIFQRRTGRRGDRCKVGRGPR